MQSILVILDCQRLILADLADLIDLKVAVKKIGSRDAAMKIKCLHRRTQLYCC